MFQPAATKPLEGTEAVKKAEKAHAQLYAIIHFADDNELEFFPCRLLTVELADASCNVPEYGFWNRLPVMCAGHGLCVVRFIEITAMMDRTSAWLR